MKEFDDILSYFPDIEPGKLPKREFLFKILSTIRSSEIRQLVHDARKSRALSNGVPTDQLIEVSGNIKEELLGLLPRKSK